MSSSDRGSVGSGGSPVPGYDLNAVEVDACEDDRMNTGALFKCGSETHKLLPRALEVGVHSVGVKPFLTFLRDMEPPADAQSLPPILALTNDNLFYGVETFTWNDLEENKLVPAWGNAFTRNTLGLRNTVRPGLSGIQFERASPFGLPTLVIWDRHV